MIVAIVVVECVLALVVGLGTLQTADVVTSLPLSDDVRRRVVWQEVLTARGWFLLAPCIAVCGEFVRVGRMAWWQLLIVHALGGWAIAWTVHAVSPAVEPIVLVGGVQETTYRPRGDEPLPGFIEQMVQRARQSAPGRVEAGLLERISSPQSSLTPALLRKFAFYVALVGLVGGFAFRREARARDRRTRWIERELGRSELRALRAQLQPHFLFNTLNSLTVLIDRDVAGAKLMVRRLAGLLRATLEDIDKDRVPLRRELEVLRHYVAIEQIRFEDRIRIEIHADDDLGGRLVPPFCLQPLVENALRHGPGALPEGGCVWVEVRHEEDALVMSVRDDGAGAAAEVTTAARAGFGLANIEARLRRLYGAGAELTTEAALGAGYSATIRIRDDARPPEPQ